MRKSSGFFPGSFSVICCKRMAAWGIVPRDVSRDGSILAYFNVNLGGLAGRGGARRGWLSDLGWRGGGAVFGDGGEGRFGDGGGFALSLCDSAECLAGGLRVAVGAVSHRCLLESLRERR